jgi:hypothetical protein
MSKLIDELAAKIEALSPAERTILVKALGRGTQVNEAALAYDTEDLAGMKSVIVLLPDDLVRAAQDAGLLADKRLEELIRRALADQPSTRMNREPHHVQRSLIRRDGRLVVEALPDEPAITSAEVLQLLRQMDE